MRSSSFGRSNVGADADIHDAGAIRTEDGQPFLVEDVAQRLSLGVRRYAQAQPHLAASAEQGDAGRIGAAARQGLEHGQEGPTEGKIGLFALVEKADDAAHDVSCLSFELAAIIHNRYLSPNQVNRASRDAEPRRSAAE